MGESVHVHAPHELSELRGDASWSQERLWEFAATFLQSLDIVCHGSRYS